MGRPKKADVDKLIPASTNLRPEQYDALCRIARSQRTHVSVLIRQCVDRVFRNCKNTEPSPLP